MNFDKEAFKKKYFYLLCYFDLTNQKIATVNLWANGLRIYKNATCIKYFSDLQSLSFSEKHPPDINKLFPFVNDNIIDNTRIITCFENFMKGSLILNGFVAHILTMKHKDLKYQQKERPIKASEVFTESSFRLINTKNEKDFDITTQTVNFSWLLKEDYQKVFNLPRDVVSILKEINNTRNRLHFMSIEQYFIGQSTISNLSKVKNFVENVYTPRLIDLNSNLKIRE